MLRFESGEKGALWALSPSAPLCRDGSIPPATFLTELAERGVVCLNSAGCSLSRVLNCRRAGIKPVVVGAMDAESLEACRSFGVRSFSMEHSISSFGWGAQIGVIEGLMELGYHVLMSDVDTAWIKNPMPYFEGTPARQAADLLISSDCASCQVCVCTITS